MSDPGELRHRLTLEAPVETPDGAGGVTRSFATVATLWAAVTPVSMRGGVEAADLAATVTGLFIAAGNQAPTAAALPGLMRPPDHELKLCQRHLELLDTTETIRTMDVTNGVTYYQGYSFKVPKRATPTMTVTTDGSSGFGPPTTSSALNGVRVQATASATTAGRTMAYALKADARL